MLELNRMVKLVWSNFVQINFVFPIER
jgi:hypothetical protein